MRNPYKSALEPVITRKIIGDVGEDDWQRIYLLLPFRGTQDLIIGSLIHAFAKAVKAANLPTFYEPTNAGCIRELLEGASFAPINRDRYIRFHRRAKAYIRQCITAEPSVASDSPVRN